MQRIKKIYCGGVFSFDYKVQDYKKLVKDDYRANILGDSELLLHKQDFIRISENLIYLGPFYFETDNMIDNNIISIEKKMIEECTDAIFLLDNGSCPGTISELIYASTVGKNIHIFYVKKQDDEETESELHSPCWYPILFSKQLNYNTLIYSCNSKEDAKNKINNLISNLKV